MTEPITNLSDAVRELGALPMPVGPEPMSDRRFAEIRSRKLDEVTRGPWLVSEDQDGTALVYVERQSAGGQVYAHVLLAADWASEADVQFVASARQSVPELVTEVDGLRAQVAELLAERHVTNEALDDAVQALHEDEAAEEPALKVFRASHDSIVFGLYRTAQAAREHCETYARREVATGVMNWVLDEPGEDDSVEELTVDGEPTGYVVTPLDVASRFGEEADE
jgi:hypothetical protein